MMMMMMMMKSMDVNSINGAFCGVRRQNILVAFVAMTRMLYRSSCSNCTTKVQSSFCSVFYHEQQQQVG